MRMLLEISSETSFFASQLLENREISGGGAEWAARDH